MMGNNSWLGTGALRMANDRPRASRLEASLLGAVLLPDSSFIAKRRLIEAAITAAGPGSKHALDVRDAAREASAAALAEPAPDV